VIAGEATLVRPAKRLAVSPDESDNRFYECAAAAEADYIVTGNARHFNKPYRTTKIVTVRHLLTLLAPGEG
jgi:predicted nucleic acid-binding protein